VKSKSRPDTDFGDEQMTKRVTNRTATIWLVVAAATLVLASCDDTTKKPVQARVPAPVPTQSQAAQQAARPSPEALPFPDNSGSRFVQIGSLRPELRPAIYVLIESVQKSFLAGQNEYQMGNFAKARADFENAVNLVLASGFPIDSDPTLADLFDQIGEATRAPEIEALQQASEEAEVPSTPAPIDELTDLTLPAGDPRLATKAERELMRVPHDLPLTVNDSVLQYLSYFTTTRGRAIVEHGLGRSGRYNEMIRRVLKEEGVPQDLIYLAQAESAFLPQAVSRAGARGIWQFMPFRGEEYDLERSYYVDERSDPEKATRAAAHHMRDLYAMFGDWYLVMAAYNSGPGNVIKAVQRTGYADFWELQKRNALPKQTRNYVPIIIALALVGKDPAVYGVQVQPEKPAQVEMVRPGHAIDLRLVSDATGVDVDDIHQLNPQLLRSVTPGDSQFELKLPVGTAEKFVEAVQHVPEEKWTSWRLHEVENGETLAEIAKHYRVTVPAIESANHMEGHAIVPAGFVLNIPTAPPAVRLVSYRVQRGDTLEGIAERFDVTIPELKRWNHITGPSVARGSRLRIYAGGSPAAAPRTKSKSAAAGRPAVHNISADHSEAAEPVQHRVKPGETLYQIAHEYRTTVDALRQRNPFLAERALEAGDVLTIQR
jgi:membrane-bound lytic murein transglycosylase D